MALFLYKPHVQGPDGNITSPDIVVDQVYLDAMPVTVNRLTHESWQQVDANETACAAYGIMALGGGALILPALILASGAIVVARKAWRLNNLDGHINEVALNDQSLALVGLPMQEIKAVGGSQDRLPRGFLLLRSATGNTCTATLTDAKLDRQLTHRVIFEPIDQDRWGENRPRPRYSIGPTQKEIKHYI